MARTTYHSRPRATRSQLRVPYATADRIRARLQSDEVDLLERADVRALLTILDDVYPARERQRTWSPFLIGIGIGILILLALM